MHPIQTLSDNVADALKRGNKIQAIKLFRVENGKRLKEAKDAIHTAFEGWQTEATAASPEEVSRTGSPLKWLAVACSGGRGRCNSH